MSRRNERVENPPQQTVKLPVPRTTSVSGKGAASPTVRQGELFEVVILSEPRQREKTTRVAEAVREGGLDECAVARAYTKLLQKLLESAEGNSNDKLTLDVLKELGEYWNRRVRRTRGRALKVTRRRWCSWCMTFRGRHARPLPGWAQNSNREKAQPGFRSI